MMLGDHTSIRHHLLGMWSVLTSQYPQQVLVALLLKTDKLTVLIWRMSIRLDFISSIAHGEAPILPKCEPYCSC